MKVLLINGSPHENGCTYTALREVADVLGKNEISTQIYYIGKKAVHGCIAADKFITNAKELMELVDYYGFLPFFRNTIPGFSVEEHTPPEQWFPDDGDDFDARYEDGLASRKDKQVYDMLVQHGSMLTKELKAACGLQKRQQGFDTVITRLQMQTYVNVEDFIYMIDRHGNLYGWGMARYTTPEEQFDASIIRTAYDRPPEVSKGRIFDYLCRRLQGVSEKQILKVIE